MLNLLGGIILRIADRITVAVLIRGSNNWTLEMGTTASYVRIVISIIAFAAIGMILRKQYNRKLFAKSATILVAYSIVLLVLEQVAQSFGTYPMIIYWLYLPVEMFTVVTSVLIKHFASDHVNWMYAIPSLFAPYLFVLFGRRAARNG